MSTCTFKGCPGGRQRRQDTGLFGIKPRITNVSDVRWCSVHGKRHPAPIICTLLLSNPSFPPVSGRSGRKNLFLERFPCTLQQCADTNNGRRVLVSVDFHCDIQLLQGACRLRRLSVATFVTSFFPSFIPGVNYLVVYVSFGGRVKLVFGAFVGRKTILPGIEYLQPKAR